MAVPSDITTKTLVPAGKPFHGVQNLFEFLHIGCSDGGVRGVGFEVVGLQSTFPPFLYIAHTKYRLNDAVDCRRGSHLVVENEAFLYQRSLDGDAVCLLIDRGAKLHSEKVENRFRDAINRNIDAGGVGEADDLLHLPADGISKRLGFRVVLQVAREQFREAAVFKFSHPQGLRM